MLLLYCTDVTVVSMSNKQSRIVVLVRACSITFSWRAWEPVGHHA